MAGCEKEGTDRHISKIKPKWVKPLLPSSPWMRTGSVRQRSSWRTCSNIECAAPCCNFQRCQKTARARFVFSKSLWGKTTGSLPDSCKARTKSLGKMIGWLSAFPTLTRRMRTGARIAASSKAATATSACKIVFLRDFPRDMVRKTNKCNHGTACLSPPRAKRIKTLSIRCTPSLRSSSSTALACSASCTAGASEAAARKLLM